MKPQSCRMFFTMLFLFVYQAIQRGGSSESSQTALYEDMLASLENGKLFVMFFEKLAGLQQSFLKRRRNQLAVDSKYSYAIFNIYQGKKKTYILISNKRKT